MMQVSLLIRMDGATHERKQRQLTGISISLCNPGSPSLSPCILTTADEIYERGMLAPLYIITSVAQEYNSSTQRLYITVSEAGDNSEGAVRKGKPDRVLRGCECTRNTTRSEEERLEHRLFKNNNNF